MIENLLLDSDTICLYRPGPGIGDAVMMLPAVAGLRKQYPNSEIIVIAISYIEPIFANHPDISHVFGFDKDAIKKGDAKMFRDELQRKGVTIYNLFEPCPAGKYESQYSPNINKSRQEIFCQACELEEYSIYDYCLPITDKQYHAKDDLNIGDDYIAVHLRSQDKWRDYRLMGWLVKALAQWGKKAGIQVVTIDQNTYYNIGGVTSVANMPLEDIIGIIARARLLIGPDSMGVHIAGALNVPCFGLFGPTDPAIRLKYRNADWLDAYADCGRQYCWYNICKQMMCLKSLQFRPNVVIEKIKSMIDKEV